MIYIRSKKRTQLCSYTAKHLPNSLLLTCLVVLVVSRQRWRLDRLKRRLYRHVPPRKQRKKEKGAIAEEWSSSQKQTETQTARVRRPVSVFSGVI